MNKPEFLYQLRQSLSGFPKEDIERTLEYYSESIDDRMEEGTGEEEAVAAMGSIAENRRNCMEELPLSKLVKERLHPRRRLAAWEILLIVLGAPIWLPLMLAGLILVLALFVVLGAVVFSFAAVIFAVFASAGAVLISSPFFFFAGERAEGLFRLGAALFCGGVAILLALSFRGIAGGIAFAGRRVFLWIKGRFIRKEREE